MDYWTVLNVWLIRGLQGKEKEINSKEIWGKDTCMDLGEWPECEELCVAR